ncbi:MAG: SAM-dependent methyltransferase, partial [Pseudobdellovibrio sp.]
MDYSHLQQKLPLNFDLVLPFLKHEQELENELLLFGVKILEKNNHYFKVQGLTHKPIWAQEWLPGCSTFNFKQKSEAVKFLKSQKNLGVFLPSPANNKLSASIRKELRELKVKRITYEIPSPFNFKYFVWTLGSENEIILCEKPHSQFPLGWHEFNEDKNTPPNRAYLKLWEVLALNYIQLKPDDVAIDVGSSPGGWTWALSEQIKKVYSVDKAPLDSKVSHHANIFYQSHDAFTIDPNDFKDCTWLFSDIICTPQRLLELIEQWHQ